jgi:hypothetical protein
MKYFGSGHGARSCVFTGFQKGCPTRAGREVFRPAGGMQTIQVAASILSLNPPARRHRSIRGTNGVWGSVERFSESIQGTVFSFEPN